MGIQHMESGGQKKDLKRTMKKQDVERHQRIRRIVERSADYDGPVDYLRAVADASRRS